MLAWPSVLTLFMVSWQDSRATGRHEAHAMALSYSLCLAALLVLERALPFRARYNGGASRMDARVDEYPPWHDAAHTALTAVAVEGTKAACEALFRGEGGRMLGVVPRGVLADGGMDATGGGAAGGLALQAFAALVVAELGTYWVHRLSHTCAVLWPFHAVHHAVPRLHALNTGRFHFANQVLATAAGFSLLFCTGFGDEAIYAFTGLYTVIGLLSHCNVDMRTGVLSFVFNTPECHRWHHSARLHESNSNYGENLMLLDHLFGTFFLGPVLLEGKSGGTAGSAGDAPGSAAAPSQMGRARYSDSMATAPAPLGRCVALPKGLSAQLWQPFAMNPLRTACGKGLAAVVAVLAAIPGPISPHDPSYYRRAPRKAV